MKDYKNTLLMPSTTFEMRGNLGNREPMFQKEWEEKKIYEKRLKMNLENEKFVLHDGPPYANGEIHTGHALNKVLKDFVIRYKSMRGYYSPYIPGWDTHGLPIETAITKKGVNRKEKTPLEFRKLCNEYALEQVEKQKVGFKRLGILGEYENPYLTLKPDYEARQLRVFAEMVKKGLIYKGLKPVYWSPTSESALAEAEIEYQDVESLSIYVAFKIVNGKDLFNNANLVIWTTTPWTLPANLAVCLGRKIDYVLVSANDNKYVVAKDLLEKSMEAFNFSSYKVLKEFKGEEIDGLKYQHPLYDRISPVIYGDFVTTSDGTGLVHIAPGHGEDDFLVGKEYGLEVYCPVDDRGIMMDERYKGLFYEKCNLEVIEDLKKLNVLLNITKIKHSYPHDWRTKKPIIFRATPQWFASIESMKDDLLNEIANVKWYPKWGEIRISNMIKDRDAWCISRQRVWGVPIPAFYMEDGEALLDYDVIMHVADIFEKHGSDAWLEMDAKDLLPKGYKNIHSPNGIFKKETDIMDVWFDSGSSYELLEARNLKYPADLYLEGSDQYRGWFNSSLSTGVATHGKAPYKAVVTHGFILDGQGRKMSKSLGNSVDPIKVCNQMGADIFRLWVSSVEYNSDVRISDDMIKQVSETYRKIRNTFKFMLGAISDFYLEKDLVKSDDLNDIDKYMLEKCDLLLETCYAAYDEYDFQLVYRSVLQFVTGVLSSFYLDFIKDILYIESKDSLRRRSVQTTLYKITFDLMRLLTPILPHTMSEAYKALNSTNKEDVYLENLADIKETHNVELLKNYDEFYKFRDDVLKALEDARNEKIIGKSMNAVVNVYPDLETKKMLEKINDNIAQILIVSKFNVLNTEEKTRIEIKEAKGETCSRCWQIVDSIDEDELCPRCKKIIEELNNEDTGC